MKTEIRDQESEIGDAGIVGVGIRDAGTRGAGIRDAGQVEVYAYPFGSDASVAPDWEGFAEAAEPASSGSSSRARGAGEGAERTDRVDWEKRLAEEKRKAFEEGREQGRLAEREAQTAALTSAEEKRMRQAGQLAENFARERDRYLHTVEQEVVKLSLAVAARILRREAQMDPLLLTGAVRVALGQLAQSTEVVLRVPAAELELWVEAIALLPNLAVKPAVLAGEGMKTGDCVMETKIGTVDLGIRSQLGEIERGFFDRARGERLEHGEKALAVAVESRA